VGLKANRPRSIDSRSIILLVGVAIVVLALILLAAALV
jgi:hypothetical protein